MSTHSLKGAALLSWKLDFQDDVLAEGSSAVSWDHFDQRVAVTVHTDSDCEPDVGSDIASDSEHDDD